MSIGYISNWVKLPSPHDGALYRVCFLARHISAPHGIRRWLETVTLNIDGTADWGNRGEVTAVHEDQDFLDRVNEAFKTDFALIDFAGR